MEHLKKFNSYPETRALESFDAGKTGESSSYYEEGLLKLIEDKLWPYVVNLPSELYKAFYKVSSSRQLLPPHLDRENFTLHKGLLLFHTTVHDPSLNFIYPGKNPFFSTTPSHGLSVAFADKREDVLNKSYRARMLVFVLKKDLTAFNSIGDISKYDIRAEVAVSANTNRDYNELRIFKETEEEMEECLHYVMEIELTKYIMEDNKYTLLTDREIEYMTRNQDFFSPLSLPLEVYEKTTWQYVNKPSLILDIFAYLLMHKEEFFQGLPDLFILCLFKPVQLWVCGKWDEDPSGTEELAMLLNYGEDLKLIFISDFLTDSGRRELYKSDKLILTEAIKKIHPSLLL